MLELSPKGTVPVLLLSDGKVLEESLDIMKWLVELDEGANLSIPDEEELCLVDRNDNEFKHWLDRYKYQVGYPQQSMQYYRDKALVFLQDLDNQLGKSDQPCSLLGSGNFADIAIFPFVRQFAFVDKPWFDQCEFLSLHKWFNIWLESALFAGVMKKYPVWRPGESGVLFGTGGAA